MALSTTFGTLTAATGGELDVNFSEVGVLTTIPGVISGTNTITLAPFVNTPTVASYEDYTRFSGVVAVDNTGPATLTVGAIGALPVYKDTSDGPVALASGDLQAGNYAVFTYDLALNTGAGGFHVSVPSAGGGSGTVTSITFNNGLTASPNPVIGSGTAGFATISNLRLLANVSGGTAVPSANTLTNILDQILGNTVGGVAVRGASWLSVTPAALALPLQSVTGGGGAAYGGVVSAVTTATGSTQGDATSIGSCNLCVLTSVGSGTGVILPATTGLPQNIAVLNRGSNNLKVYPASGGQIEALGANAADTVVATSGNAAYSASASGQWYRTVAS